MANTPNDYSIPCQGITLEKIKEIVDKNIKIFNIPIGSSEVWPNGIVAVKGEGSFQNRKIKFEFFAKIEKSDLKLKFNNNFNIKAIMALPEPRDSPSKENDCAIFLQFWDGLLQDMGWGGRLDIGKPRSPKMVSKTPPMAPAKSPSPPSSVKPPSALIKQESVPQPVKTAAPPSKPISNIPQSALSKAMEASRNLKPATASSLRIDYNAIPENVSPFLLDKLGKNPNYYKFKRSPRLQR